MTTVAKLDGLAGFLKRQRGRVLRHQPGGRGGGRRAEHGDDPGGGEHFDGLIEPFEVELALRRFHGRPGELSHPGHGHPGGFH